MVGRIFQPLGPEWLSSSQDIRRRPLSYEVHQCAPIVPEGELHENAFKSGCPARPNALVECRLRSGLLHQKNSTSVIVIDRCPEQGTLVKGPESVLTQS